jgi:hypothetical protein
MFWSKRALCLFFLLAGLSLRAHAEGGESGGESVSESAGESGAQSGKAYSGSQSDAWEKVQTELTSLRGKIEVQEASIKTLLQQKSGLKGDQLRAKIEELKKEHAKLEQMTGDYNKLEEQYETRFPERGLKEPRVYVRRPVKSLQSMESELSLDDRVKRVQAKVLSQYGRDKKKKKSGSPAKVSSGDQSEKKPPDVTDPIIYQK